MNKYSYILNFYDDCSKRMIERIYHSRQEAIREAENKVNVKYEQVSLYKVNDKREIIKKIF